MSIDENIKIETDKRLNELKQRAAEKGIVLSAMEEIYFKMGIKYGIMIAGLSLVAGVNDEL